MLREQARSLSKSLGIYRMIRPITQRFINRAALRRERADEQFYRQFVAPGDLVFDVGANFGEKSRLFLRLGARVVAIEPQADCVREIGARCGRPKQLTVVPAAVGAERGTATFYIRSCRAGSGLTPDWDGAVVDTMPVEITTLDDLIAAHGQPRYIKIDVEGFELNVLRGLTHPVEALSFEFHLTPENIAQTRDCVELLASRSEIELNVTPAEEMRFAWPQWRTATEFLAAFPDALRQQSGFPYGDIFVRRVASTFLNNR